MSPKKKRNKQQSRPCRDPQTTRRQRLIILKQESYFTMTASEECGKWKILLEEIELNLNRFSFVL